MKPRSSIKRGHQAPHVGVRLTAVVVVAVVVVVGVVIVIVVVVADVDGLGSSTVEGFENFYQKFVNRVGPDLK